MIADIDVSRHADQVKAMAEEWLEAQSHAEALRYLVELCGGIETVDFELQRTVTW